MCPQGTKDPVGDEIGAVGSKNDIKKKRFIDKRYDGKETDGDNYAKNNFSEFIQMIPELSLIHI